MNRLEADAKAIRVMMSTINRCPNIVSKGLEGESLDYCRESERPSGRIKTCLLVGGGECEVWNDIQKEARK